MSSDNENDFDFTNNQLEEQEVDGKRFKEESISSNYPDELISSNDKLWAAIGYPIPLFSVLALVMEDKKDDPFIRYHAVQSIVFNIVMWAVIVLLGIITLGIGSMCAPVLWLITLWPAYDAYRGNLTELPVISAFINGRGWLS
jgi:uncharacterized membrane protein